MKRQACAGGLLIVTCAISVTLGQRAPTVAPEESSQDERPANIADKSPPFLDHHIAAIHASRKQEAAICEAIRQRLPDHLNRVPLDEFLAFIRQKTNINIVLDDAALIEEGLPSDTPISARSRGLPIDVVLDHVLDPLGLAWYIDDEALHISNASRVSNRHFTRVYSLRPFKRVLEPNGRIAAEQAFETIAEAVRNCTSGAWQAHQEIGGTISVLGDSLVVRQTYAVQLEVERVLVGLRSIASGEMRRGSIAIPPLTEVETAIHAALDRKVTLKLVDTPLEDAVRFLEDKLGVGIEIDKAALVQEGVTDDEPISFEAEDFPIRSALESMLKPLGLTVVVVENMLHVTLRISCPRFRAVVFDVSDLTAKTEVESIITFIQQETSGPWLEIEGTGGGIQNPFPGALLVFQEPRVLAEIAVLLDDLRK